MCSKTSPMYAASVKESKIHCVPNYKLRFIRNKYKNSYVFVLYNNICTTFLYFEFMHAGWHLRKSRCSSHDRIKEKPTKQKMNCYCIITTLKTFTDSASQMDYLRQHFSGHNFKNKIILMQFSGPNSREQNIWR